VKPVDPTDFQRDIEIQLRILRGPVKTALQNVSGDMAANTAARLIIERCLAGCAIFEPDWVTRRATVGDRAFYQRAGIFGDTEPWPEPPPEPERGRCRICGANDIDVLGEELARAMWTALVPGTPFEKSGQHRASFLLIAHRAINWLGRAHAEHSPWD
jgi:hypothetical protein